MREFLILQVRVFFSILREPIFAIARRRLVLRIFVTYDQASLLFPDTKKEKGRLIAGYDFREVPLSEISKTISP